MSKITSLLRWTVLLAGYALGVASLCGQTVSDCQAWTQVKGWRGSFTLKGTGTGKEWDSSHTLNVTLSATLDLDRPFLGFSCNAIDAVTGTRWPRLAWAGQLSESISFRVEEVSFDGCRRTLYVAESPGEAMPPGWPLVVFDFAAGTYYFYHSELFFGASGHWRQTLSCSGGQEVSVKQSWGWGPAASGATGQFMQMFKFPLPVASQPLSGSRQFKAGMIWPGSHGGTSPPFDWELSWNFVGIPAPRPELIVDPIPYPTWRPAAGPDETTPPAADKDLEIRATLQQPDGKPPTTKAKKFIFELLRTSQQPGIAMNFPQRKIAKNTFDLQFLPERNPELTVSNDGQRAETRTGEFDKASANLTPLDWGGWSWIKVTAEMPDGPPIVGYLRGDKAQTEIRLPKRAPDSKIADVWKSEQGVSLPDDDDQEKEPEGLPGCDGDGLTLYEEYRGFRENSERIEGNPRKKDLFLYNKGGVIVDFGIWLFRTWSRLEVHGRLTAAEIDAEQRVINENWSQDAPHAVDQHALIINPASRTAIVWKDGRLGGDKRGRPSLVEGIDVDPEQEDTFEFQLGFARGPRRTSMSDQIMQGGRTVEHMLMHALGAEHHGPANADRLLDLIFLWPDDPGNTYGRPIFVHMDYGLTTLLEEGTGADRAQSYLAERRQAVEQLPWLLSRGYSEAMKNALVVYLKGRDLTLLVGIEHGPHSGQEDCAMRFHSAEAYPAYLIDPDTYFLAPPGTEPALTAMCYSKEGTGINKPGRKPTPRYFDAIFDGYGACGTWMCVNDRIPLRGRPESAGYQFAREVKKK